MPETTIQAPTATPQAPSSAPGGSPSIPAGIAPPASPIAAPKPGSARARMHERIDSISRDPNAPEVRPERRQDPPSNTPKRDTAPKPQQKPNPDEQKAGKADPNVDPADQSSDSDEQSADPAEQTEGKTGEQLDGKKQSPWKLVNRFKARTIELENQLQEIRSQMKDPKEVESMTQRLTQAEARAQELEQEMRYHDFTKTNEFRTQYQEPYEKAWKSAIDDLSGITFADPVSGMERALNPQDLMDVVGLPLGKARALAEQLYGSFANDVMTHRKSILDLFQKQQAAIDDAKQNGGERIKQRAEQIQKMRSAIQKETREIFEAANKSIMEDPKYSKFFKPIEGDEQATTILEKGYKFVDEAFKLNAADPRLNKEQRAEVVKKQAAVRHRAAAFGRMRHQLGKAEARIAALTKELDQFKSSNPGGGDAQAQRAGAPNQGKARDRVMASLEAISRPS